MRAFYILPLSASPGGGSGQISVYGLGPLFAVCVFGLFIFE